ncbi:hypothetical protein [Costertonia aggregata]|uniref:Uncharacterized protein n=1 Tax=Costertonia aggregata TaxID=343403 RepID=A0A7H9APU6_9FLAO|nr:hypothetical protein [Costertonia aggregata]QLG45501.1 hypothetical protein HYG79_09130 [Costertonia aggregata]
MKLSFIFILSLVLTMTVVAPAIIQLMKSGNDTFIITDFNEEKDSTKEKKELSEKNHFINNYSNIIVPAATTLYRHSAQYVENYRRFDIEIFLPPPKHMG